MCLIGKSLNRAILEYAAQATYCENTLQCMSPQVTLGEHADRSAKCPLSGGSRRRALCSHVLIRLWRVAVLQAGGTFGRGREPARLHVFGPVGRSADDKPSRRSFGLLDPVAKLLHARGLGVAVADDLLAGHEIVAVLRDDAEGCRIADAAAAGKRERSEASDQPEQISYASRHAVPRVPDRTNR